MAERMHTFQFKVTVAEHKAIFTAAKRSGLTASGWARNRLKQIADDEKRKVSERIVKALVGGGE